MSPPRPLPPPLAQEPGWSLSFAGCGFRSLYYLGALSALLEEAPEIVLGAKCFSGASSGSLVAAALAVGVSLTSLVSELVLVASEARSLPLGVFSPSFSLLRRLRGALLKLLPLDSHTLASGRLCVSITRVHDGKNLRVTQFSSRDQLVQVLLCSCFFPIYCGFLPPSYKGEWFMDGALSDNQPLSEFTNTIRFSPFSGESDICPKESGFSPIQVCYGNVSIEVNTGNVHRVWTSFLPQSPQVLLQICESGYTDALLFLSHSAQGSAHSSEHSLKTGPKTGPTTRPKTGPKTGPKTRLRTRKAEPSRVLPEDFRRVLTADSLDLPPPLLLCDRLGLVLALALSLVLGLDVCLVLSLVLGLIQLVLLPC